MLHVQKFLEHYNFDDLVSQFGIKLNFHPTEDLVIMNYDQINSPKYHPISMECRGLVLNTKSKMIVAKGFDRFFNLGEDVDKDRKFNWDNFLCYEKLDGSLIIVFNYNGKWFINTRGSWATDTLQYTNFTWRELALKGLGGESNLAKLDPRFTYCFELCSPFNKVVRHYPETKCVLLGKFFNGGYYTVEYDTIHEYKNWFEVVPSYDMKYVEQIKDYLENLKDASFEGFVVRDNNGHRIKVKNPKYVDLHRMKGNNNEGFSPKNLISFILDGEQDEVLVYFPEIKDQVYNMKKKIDVELNKLYDLWDSYQLIESQKDFALAIVPRTKLSPILFAAKKSDVHPSKLIHQFKDLLLAQLFPKGIL